MLRAALVCLALTASAARAQPAASGPDGPADAAVRATVGRLFDGMRAADSSAVRATFHPRVRLMTAVVRDGVPGVAESPVGAFLAAVATPGLDLDERTADAYPVLVDGGLAVAWTPYRFYASGTFSHCGTNAFTLALTDGGWQILQVVDTRRADCDGPDADPDGAAGR